MLPARARVRRRDEFAVALRGRRTRNGPLVVHLGLDERQHDQSARAGVIVSKIVGHAVDRNRTRRRIRHLMAGTVKDLPRGSVVVVRALPGAADASTSDLRNALDSSLSRLGLTPRP